MRQASDDIFPMRSALLADELRGVGVERLADDVQTAITAAWSAHRHEWHAGHNSTAARAAGRIVEALRLPVRLRPTVQEALEWMLPAADLEPAPGLRETLSALADAGVAVGLISDTGFTPGRVLRQRLDQLGIGWCFAGMTFSDETGLYKPDPRIFEHAARYLQTEPGQIVHVGDVPDRDVRGALDAGWHARRCTWFHDDRRPPHAPELTALCDILEIVAGPGS